MIDRYVAIDLKTAREFVQESVVSVGETFTRPQDDWAAMTWLFTRDGLVLAHIDIEPETKDLVKPMIACLLREKRPKVAALLLSCYMMSATGPLAQETVRVAGEFGVRNFPGRIEVLMLEVADSEKSENWTAEIVRYDKKPPTLKPWEPGFDNGSGRMANILRDGFASIRA